MVSTPLKREVAVAYCFFNLVKSLIFLTADFEYIGKKKIEVAKAADLRNRCLLLWYMIALCQTKRRHFVDGVRIFQVMNSRKQ